MSSDILSIGDFKERFDPLLAQEFDRHLARASAFTRDEDCASLLAHIKEIALAGGKRIRPYVAYLMYRTAGGTEDILENLIAFEIFHTFALVHDDIIDRSPLRHGERSLHEYAQTFVSGTPEKVEHLSEGLALLAGDLAFSWSRESFLRGAPSLQASSLFDDMIYAVVLGQMLDVKLMCAPNPSEATIMEKTSLKTAEYTFVYPMRIGASLADKADEYMSWCGDIGTSLGIAFQLQDDLIDIIGDQKTAGKNVLQDIAEGQHTVFTAYVRTHGSEQDRDELAGCFGKSLTDESRVILETLFERSGAVAYGRARIADELQKAKVALTKLEEGSPARTAWGQLLARMEHRVA